MAARDDQDRTAARKGSSAKRRGGDQASARKQAPGRKKAPARKKATGRKNAPARKKATGRKNAPARKKSASRKKAAAKNTSTGHKKATARKKATAPKKATAGKKAAASKKRAAAKKASARKRKPGTTTAKTVRGEAAKSARRPGAKAAAATRAATGRARKPGAASKRKPSAARSKAAGTARGGGGRVHRTGSAKKHRTRAGLPTSLSAMLGRLAEELPSGLDGPVREIGEQVSRLESQISDATRAREQRWESRQGELVDDLTDALEGIRDFVESPLRVMRRRPREDEPGREGAGQETESGDGAAARRRGLRRLRRAVRVPVEGLVEPGFEPVADQFQRNFERRGDHGAAVCLYADGEPVVDLWGGHRDAAGRRPWAEDTIALVFSATKGITATCVHKLAEDGQLDLDAPVADYWPEFGAAGKRRIPIRYVLAHRAGLPTVDRPMDTTDVFAWEPVVEAIAAQVPDWTPGEAHGYHPRTFGWILGELIRRVTGLSVGAWFASEIARPLGLDFYIGLGAEHEHRVAELITPEAPSNAIASAIQNLFMGPNTNLGRALTGPGELGYGPIWNSRQLHAAQIPSSNGIGSARALARHYAALIGEVDGFRTLEEETVERARSLQVKGRDKLIQIPTRFGLGFMLPPTLGSSCGPAAFGHPGAGGSLGFADPDAGLALGFVVNKMEMGLTGDARSSSLVEAAYRCL